jgi:CBS domain-containing protein
MQVREVMTSDVQIASPNDSVCDAALLMAQEDCGVLPVGESDRLLGMVTDRDIVVRCLADGRDPTTCRISEVMTPEVKYCFEDEDLDHVADNMAELQVRRLPVMNRDKQLVGIVALGDIATGYQSAKAGEALSGVSEPAHG